MAKEEKAKISTMVHPSYSQLIGFWTKYRDAFEGGMDFVDDYLQKFSTREDDANFDLRKLISYCPAHAKAAILDVRNSIYQRLTAVTRIGGSKSYQEAITGSLRGVDLQGRTMSDFIGTQILPEMIVIKKVGVYIDKPEVLDGETLLEAQDKRPYLYFYKAEQIKAWSYDEYMRLTSVLLEDTRNVVNEEYGLTTGTVTVYRHLLLTEEGVKVTFYNAEDEVIKGGGMLALERIPFVIFEISSSLMTDVADYQVALLNLASSDMRYVTASNFPFYIEQYNESFDLNMLKKATPGAKGEDSEAKKSKQQAIDVGVAQGRKYPKGMDAPAFIHPSPEPLLASLAKQKELKEEIRQIINLSISNLEPTRESSESKEHDERGLESGLSYIGMELNYGEREIAEIWAMYEGGNAATITYPTDYKLLSDAERRAEAKECEEMMGKIPSPTYKKVMAKKIIKLTLGNTATPDTLALINEEIDSAPVIISDPDTIRSDHEAGLVGDELASQLRGYPKGEYLKAQADHAERATRVLAAQTSNKDLTNDPDKDKNKKKEEQDTTLNEDGSDKTRGGGK